MNQERARLKGEMEHGYHPVHPPEGLLGESRVRSSARRLKRALLKGILAGLFCALPRLALAQGGPPLLSDDPGTPGNGRTELNIAFTAQKLRSTTQYGTPLADWNTGIGDRIQAKIQIPWLIGTARAEPTESALGPVLLGFKWRYLDENPSGVDASFYPQASFTTNAHSIRSGLVPEGMTLLLPAEFARDLGILSVNVEAGYLLQEEAPEEWIWGIALGRKITEEIEVLGELHGEASRDFERSEFVFNLGARIQLTKLNSILLSAGRGVRGAALGEPSFLGYLGLQFNF